MCICSAVPLAQSWHKQHTHTYTRQMRQTKPIVVRPSERLPGRRQMLCYSVPANTISGDAMPSREPQGALRFSPKYSQSHKANCFCCFPPPITDPVYQPAKSLKKPRRLGAHCTLGCVFVRLRMLTGDEELCDVEK